MLGERLQPLLVRRHLVVHQLFSLVVVLVILHHLVKDADSFGVKVLLNPLLERQCVSATFTIKRGIGTVVAWVQFKVRKVKRKVIERLPERIAVAVVEVVASSDLLRRQLPLGSKNLSNEAHGAAQPLHVEVVLLLLGKGAGSAGLVAFGIARYADAFGDNRHFFSIRCLAFEFTRGGHAPFAGRDDGATFFRGAKLFEVFLHAPTERVHPSAGREIGQAVRTEYL